MNELRCIGIYVAMIIITARIFVVITKKFQGYIDEVDMFWIPGVSMIWPLALPFAAVFLFGYAIMKIVNK